MDRLAIGRRGCAGHCRNPLTETLVMSLKGSAFGTFDDWHKPDLTGLSDYELDQYQRKYEAMRLYCSNATIKEIKDCTGISKTTVYYYLRRCMECAPDGSLWGCRALIPHLFIHGYKRTLPARRKLSEAKGGFSGMLRQTFEKFPGLEADFIKLIKASVTPNSVKEFRKRSFSYHRDFLKLLEKYGANGHEWPFNTKHLGLRTISKFVQETKNNLHNLFIKFEGESAAKAHLAVGRSARPALKFTEPFDAVEIDGYHWDCHSAVRFKTPDGLYVNVGISRLWVVLMVDVASFAVLAYKCVFTSEPSAQDVVDVMRYSICGQPRPDPVIDGLVYPENGGLPNAVINECKGALFSVAKFDGALAHLSEKVSNFARKELGFFWTLGPPGHFERRAHVEHLFALFSQNVFCRLPSTTGHGPGNGKAPNAEQIAKRIPILAEEILHLLDVEIAQYNARMSEGLCFLSPLDYLREKMAKDNNHFLPRTLGRRCQSTEVLQTKKLVTVRGNTKGGRRPYIQFMRVRYSSPLLADGWGLIGKKLTIFIDEADLRAITAYTPDGFLLGRLVAQGKWADTKHDLKTRMAINTKMADRALQVASEQNPVQVYLAALSASSKSGGDINARDATEAARVANEAGIELQMTEAPAYIVKDSGKMLEYSDSLIIGKPIPDLNDVINKKRRGS
ncbi:helix-turn-helix domain-containing protein [Pseudomonas abietaniphila]|uniref:helix-turn-helix domain-containing protein n=1 Tax=Pseudomonas abietaniphila TaxID=89065 RepID=UPI0032171633